MRALGTGRKDGKGETIQMDILAYHDEETGFSAMERLTGFSTAIVAEEIARGAISLGCPPYEQAMTGRRFVEEIQRRGVDLRITRCSS